MCSRICGIPKIELCGSEQDWIDIRQRSEMLFSSFMPEYWNCLAPVLDKFLDSYRGNVDHNFWQRMVKYIGHGRGSGAYSTVSGWVNILYPFINEKSNNYSLKSWNDLSQEDGPEPEQFPYVISSAPVIWNYLGKIYNLHFHGGIFGYTLDEEKTIRITSGWVVSHDVPLDPKELCDELKKEIQTLESGPIDDNIQSRIKLLKREIAKKEQLINT